MKKGQIKDLDRFKDMYLMEEEGDKLDEDNEDYDD